MQQPTIATIGSSTMLACCTFGLPRQSTQLRQEATQIETDKHAEKGTVRASAFYFRKAEGKKEIDGLADLKSFQYDYRKAVYTLARYPYAGGFNLAPAAVVEELLAVKSKYDELGNAVWMKWADDVYPDWAVPDAAKARMGDLYNEADFPSLNDCKKRFSCECTIVPLGEAEQVKRIMLISKQSAELLEKSIDAKVQTQIEELHTSIWKDLMSPLEKIVEVFNKDKPKIYETLLGNLLEIVNVIPSYDALTKDPKLQQAAATAKAVFTTMTTADLKKSEEARKLALSTAKDIITTFTPYARKFAA